MKLLRKYYESLHFSENRRKMCIRDSLKDMKVVQEMYARGFEFEPIDLFKAHSRNFQVMDGKIMPSLNSIDGLGEKAADSIVEAAKNGAFLSKDDFRERSKASKTIVELLDSLGILGCLLYTSRCV